MATDEFQCNLGTLGNGLSTLDDLSMNNQEWTTEEYFSNSWIKHDPLYTKTIYEHLTYKIIKNQLFKALAKHLATLGLLRVWIYFNPQEYLQLFFTKST